MKVEPAPPEHRPYSVRRRYTVWAWAEYPVIALRPRAAAVVFRLPFGITKELAEHSLHSHVP